MSFCNERTFLQSPARVARKIRCLRLRTDRWAFRQLTVSHLVGLSGPFALPWARIQLVLRLAIVTTTLRVVHSVPVSRLSAWAEALSTGLWFPLAFRLVAFASGTIPVPLGSWADLAVGLLWRFAGQTTTGLPRSAPGSCEGRGCLVYSGAGVSYKKKARIFLPVGPLLPSWSTILRQPQE
jgi:hypothetical protein